jgi:predicted alpha/beta hydrolase
MQAGIIESQDGTKIAARVFEPGGPCRGSVVIGGAMGVRQDYYAAFAQWLATQGWAPVAVAGRAFGSARSMSHHPFVKARAWPRDAGWRA